MSEATLEITPTWADAWVVSGKGEGITAGIEGGVSPSITHMVCVRVAVLILTYRF